MNPRIKELAEQATSIVEMVGPQGYTSSYANFDKEKFAELIVQDCCQAVERRYKYSNGTPVSFWEMSQDVQDLLKEHFGVEE